jgi:tetratricopeptide (TPR) repeat protein/predicted Ser/Thr protein kinase
MPSERDLQMAKLCVERGYASPAQVEECLREISSTGQTLRPLEAVLRRRGYISEHVYRDLSSSQRRALLADTLRKCPACDTVYSGDLCPRCIVDFAQSPSDPDLQALEEETSPRPGRPSPALDPEVETAAASPKNRFGKYVLVRELGAGGMGVVFKAWQSDLRRFVALKFIRGIEAAEDLERFIREAQLAATLSHPGIAPIYESGEHEGKHFFAMQYVEGQTFDRLLASKEPMPVRKRVEILALAAEAVEYAHERGVIHRDLKPQNIMVDPKGRVFVMDFGLAKSVRTGSSLTGSGFAVGTPSYMAPEQAQADAFRIGPRSDVYALGAILYEIGAGQPPFGGGAALQVLLDVVNRDPVPPRRLNPRFHAELETIALKALEKHPDRRFTSAGEFGADVRRWLAGEPIHARPSGAASRVLRRIWKHKVLSAGFLAILVGLGIGAWALIFRHGIVEEENRVRSVRASALPYYQEAAAAYDEADAIRRNVTSKPSRYRELLRKVEENTREAVRRDPSYADAHFLLGLTIQRQFVAGRDPIASFSRVIELEPTHVRAYLERGRARLQGLYELYGLDSVSVRTGNRELVFAFKSRDPGLEALRSATLSDLREAQRLNPKPSEKALLEGAAGLAAWRPGEDADLDSTERRLNQAAELAPNDPYPRFLLSRARLLRRDVKGASDLLVQAIGLAPHDFSLLYEGASTLTYAGRLKEALEYADRAIQIWPEHYRMHVKHGNILAETGDSELAMRDFEHAIALDPHHPEPYLSAGGLRLDQDRPAEALRLYQDGIKFAPDDVNLLEGRAAALSALGRNEDAEADMDRVLTARTDAESYSNRGVIRSRRGRAREALEDFERALRMEPENANVLFSLGSHLSRQEKDEEALQHFRRSLELGRDHRDTHFAIGDALFHLNRYDEALSHLELALKQGREHADTFLRLGQTLLRLKRYSEALPFLESALKRGRNDAPVHRALGAVFFNLERYPDALPEFQESVRREPGSADDVWGLADTLGKLRRFGEAEAEYSKGIALKKDNPLAYSGRAVCRCELGRLDEGLRDYEEALRLKPEDSGFFREVALIHYTRKKYPEALEYVEKSIAAGRNDSDIFSLHGETLRHLERPVSAEEAFDRAIQLKKDDPILHFYRCRVRYSNKKRDAALADLEEALRINPEFAPAIGQRGMIRVWEKMFKEAVDDLKRAMSLQPGLRGTLQPYLDQALREMKRTDE